MVYVFLAEGFEEVEALAPVDVLRRAGAEVRTVGVGGKTVTGARGVPVLADLTDAEAAASGLSGELEMIVLPGGSPGYKNLEKSPVVQKFIDYAFEKGKWIGAICAAPTILGRKGLLKGRRAVCFPGMESELTGTVPGEGRVCEDGNLITGIGPGASLEFGLRLSAKLKGESRADEVGVAMQCK